MLRLISLLNEYEYRIIELPAGFLAMYLVKKFGHRTIISTGLIFSGLGCLITGFVPNGNKQSKF